MSKKGKKDTKVMEPIVWNSMKIKEAFNKKFKKGKLTFFRISNPEGDLDIILSTKMLKYRKKAAQKLYKSAKDNYKACRKALASIGTQKTNAKQIQQLEKDLVTAKLLKVQAKDYYRLAKADYKVFNRRNKEILASE